MDLTLNLLLLTQDWESFTSFYPGPKTILCPDGQMYSIIFGRINNSMNSPNLKTSPWMKHTHSRQWSGLSLSLQHFLNLPLSSIAVCLFVFVDTGRILLICLFISKLCPLQSILIQLPHKYCGKLSWLSSIQNVQWPFLTRLACPSWCSFISLLIFSSFSPITLPSSPTH